MASRTAATPGPPPPAGRVRVPSPLIRSRMPSGRGATEQPNATGDGDAALTPVFWLMVALTGVAAGLFGDLMMLILFSVQDLAFGSQAGGSLDAAAAHAPDVRRIAVLLTAGAFGGAAWYLPRRLTPGEKTEIDDVVWGEGERLSFRRSLGTSVISEVVIGMGASIGRENAPKLMGGAAVPPPAAQPLQQRGQAPGQRVGGYGDQQHRERRGEPGSADAGGDAVPAERPGERGQREYADQRPVQVDAFAEPRAERRGAVHRDDQQ